MPEYNFSSLYIVLPPASITDELVGFAAKEMK
jgi:hypothetical protein